MVALKGHVNAKDWRIDMYMHIFFSSCFTSKTWESKKWTYTYATILFVFYVEDVKIKKIDVYLCNNLFFVFYVEDVKIQKFDVYLYNNFFVLYVEDVTGKKKCLLIFSFFCTQWPWRDTQTQTIDVQVYKLYATFSCSFTWKT